ncbi:MAG: hypothetical protein ABEH65_06970 [Halobacteriales archaeon]
MSGPSEDGDTSLAYKQGQILKHLPGGKTILDAKILTYRRGADAFEHVLSYIGLEELAADIHADTETAIEQSKAGYKGQAPPERSR